MGGFVPQGPGVTHEDRIFEEPDVSHGKHLLDRVSTEPHLLSHVGRTMRRRRRVGNLHVHEASPSSPIPTRPDRDVGWQQDPADPLGHYAFGLGDGSSWAWHSDWKPTLLCVPSQKGLLAECPQRHRETTVRPARPYTRPSRSQIVMPSPSRR